MSARTVRKAKRPDLQDYFRARIDFHVNGSMARSHPRLPAGVEWVKGDVTDPTIYAFMKDGTQWLWAGGQYANRKINGCYAPLMPKPVTPSTSVAAPSATTR